jgi:hypothetical protein
MSDLPSPSSSTEPTPARGTPFAEPIASIPPSLTQPPPPKLTQNPQIMAALITGIISLMVAIVGIVPALVEAAKDDPTPTPPPLAAIVATFTPVNTQIVQEAPTDTPPPAPTDTPVPPTATTEQISQPNIVPVGATSTSLPVIGSSPVPADPQPTADTATSTSNNNNSAAREPNVRLYFDNASFTIRNQDANRKILTDVSFYSDDARWNASQWGLIHQDFKKQKCLRLRDASLGPRNPPSDCQGTNLLSLMEVGTPVIFWRDADGFRVERNGVEIGICTVSPCDLYLPPN